MLTISQLAAYAGVTVRAVRHYHQVGLLPEPERDASGYRRYDAASVIDLIRIRTLAEAGVPLARVHELLAADAEEFAAAVADIDHRLRTKIRQLQEHRRRIARLASGDSLALPAEVVSYLDLLRDNGVSPALVDGERDGWILVAARWPEQIPALMADKRAQFDDPRTLQLYQLIGEAVEVGLSEERVGALADLLVQMLEEADARGEIEQQGEEMNDDTFIALLDSFAASSHPLMERLQELMSERGWSGWTRIERVPDRSR